MRGLSGVLHHARKMDLTATKPFPTVRVVSLDAMNTIIEMKEPYSVIYSRVASQYGYPVNPYQVAAAFPHHVESFSNSYPCFGCKSIGHAEWWKKVVQGCLREASASVIPQEMADTIAHQLFNFYNSGNAWRIVDSQLKAFLSDVRGRGIGTAVVSNFDARLRRILNDMDLYSLFDIVVISGEVGVEKPDPSIFKLVTEQFKLASASELLHIGDSLKKDYQAAKYFGANAVLFDPFSSNSDVPCVDKITSFTQLKLG